MKFIKLIIALFICSTSFGQITNITGDEPRATLPLTTDKTNKFVWMLGADGKIYRIHPDSIGSGSGGGGGGATPQLDNLGTTSINAALLFQTGIDIGSTTLPARNIRFYGSGTFGSHSYTLGGTPTGHRTITFPDADINVARTNAAQTFTGVQTFSSNPTFSALSSGQVPVAGSGGALAGSNNFFWSESLKRLIVNGTTNVDPVVTIRRDLTGIYDHLRLNGTADALTDGYINFGDGGSGGYFPKVIYATDATTGNQTIHRYQVVDNSTSIGAIYTVANQNYSAALANASAKLYQWQKFGTALMTMDVDGDLAIGTATPAATAIVDLTSTTKGFLPPRMTGTQAEAISSPAEGLLIYSTDGSGSTITSKGWWGYDGSAWVKLN